MPDGIHFFWLSSYTITEARAPIILCSLQKKTKNKNKEKHFICIHIYHLANSRDKIPTQIKIVTEWQKCFNDEICVGQKIIIIANYQSQYCCQLFAFVSLEFASFVELRKSFEMNEVHAR